METKGKKDNNITDFNPQDWDTKKSTQGVESHSRMDEDTMQSAEEIIKEEITPNKPSSRESGTFN